MAMTQVNRTQPRARTGLPRLADRAPTPSPKQNCGGTELRPSLERFLTHLRDFRDCSPATVVAYAQDGGRFIEYLEADGVFCVEEVRPEHANRYAAGLAGLAPATIRRQGYCLRSWFGHLFQTGIIPGNPIAGLELPKRRPALPRMPSREECDALLAACRNNRERVVITLMLMAGLRRAELLSLSVEDFSPGFLEVRVLGKGRKERVVRLCCAVQAAVRAYLENRGALAGPLVTGRQGGRLCTNGLYRLFRGLLRRAGLDGSGITPHGLRHRFATDLVRAGVNVATIAALMGHSSISVTSQYLHADAGGKASAVARLPWNIGIEARQAEETAPHELPSPEAGTSAR